MKATQACVPDERVMWLQAGHASKYGQSIRTPSPKLEVWGAICSFHWMVTALWDQESKKGNTKSHMGRNCHKGLLDVTPDLEAWLGYPWRNVVVLQDAVLVA